MSILEITDAQVISLVRQLPADSKKAALIVLAEEAGQRRQQRMAIAEEQLRRRAHERGLDWNALDEPEREALVNRLLHEA